MELLRIRFRICSFNTPSLELFVSTNKDGMAHDNEPRRKSVVGYRQVSTPHHTTHHTTAQHSTAPSPTALLLLQLLLKQRNVERQTSISRNWWISEIWTAPEKQLSTENGNGNPNHQQNDQNRNNCRPFSGEVLENSHSGNKIKLWLILILLVTKRTLSVVRAGWLLSHCGRSVPVPHFNFSSCSLSLQLFRNAFFLRQNKRCC